VQPIITEHSETLQQTPPEIVSRLIGLTEQKTGPSDQGLADITHVIWPESVLPFYLSSYPEGLARIARMLPPGTTLLTGAPREPQDIGVIGEEPIQSVGGDTHGHGVEAPPALIALQRRGLAGIEAQALGIDDAFRQGRHIAQTEIEALAGDGMDGVGRIAHQRQAVIHIAVGVGQGQRIAEAAAGGERCAAYRGS